MKSNSKRNLMVILIALGLILILPVVLSACGGTSTDTTESPVTTAPATTDTTNGSDTTAGSGTTVTSSGTGAQVDIKGFAFVPDTITIKVGDTVTWTNSDGTRHTVTADNGEFDSGNMDDGATFSFTFTTAGTFPYHCTLHPNMTATVIVQ